ncbi:MAG TPA: DNA-formamidopyrimidine glycosylase family protein [Verrucomicrobiae bacterium]|nr:DNA-formamidopyrimidine glycosylase family protein [Verrucomicrobiae bacterium]
MPELPEVQILVNVLALRLTGARIRSTEVRDPKIRLAGHLAGQRIQEVRRLGKNIVVDLSGGLHLVIHLRMTGWFEFEKPPRYRVALHTSRGTAYFEDPRRLGTMELVTTALLEHRRQQLGPDPLGDDCDLSRLRGTSRPVKVALLDQRLISGVGNIYASESLWRARINPRRRSDRLRPDELGRLRRGIVASLRRAIAYGPRIFEVQGFAVYGRQGKECPRCGTTIRRFVQSQRSTYFCPRCQR